MRNQWVAYLVALVLALALIASAIWLKGTAAKQWIDAAIYLALGFYIAQFAGINWRAN